MAFLVIDPRSVGVDRLLHRNSDSSTTDSRSRRKLLRPADFDGEAEPTAEPIGARTEPKVILIIFFDYILINYTKFYFVHDCSSLVRST